MTSLVLLAVLFDRQSALHAPGCLAARWWYALSTPDALTGPSFQMSFAAVVALIAAYETDWCAAGHAATRAMSRGSPIMSALWR